MRLDSDDEELDSQIKTKNEKHFDKYSSLCNCSPACTTRTTNAKDISLSFGKLSELQKRNTIRSMLFSLTSSSSEINELSLHEHKRRRKLKNNKSKEMEEAESDINNDNNNNNRNMNVSTTYSSKGKRVCKSSVPSAHEGNRHAYQVKKVLDAYIEGNETVRSNFFKNGSEYRNSNTVSA